LNNKVLLLVFISCLSACDNDEPQRVNVMDIHTDADDPAMKDFIFIGAEQNPLDDSSVEEIKVVQDPNKFTVDLDGKRVFFPEKGWLNAKDFWPIYYGQPEKLPANLDFELIEKLKEKTQTEEQLS